MQFILEGLLFGLFLSISLGPIFIALTQTAVEKGGRAGMTVGLGVWISDFLIVGVTYLFIKRISATIESESFQFWLGMAGGIVMIAFGIGSMIKKVQLNLNEQKHVYKDYLGFWLKGFLVNTINPFTFLFWLSTISTYIIGRKINNTEAIIFLSSILFMIVASDAFKVILAKSIRSKLKSSHIEKFSKVAGLGLFCFGLYLIIQTMRVF